MAADCAPIESGIRYRLLFGRDRGGLRKIQLFTAWIMEEMAAINEAFMKQFPGAA